MACNLVRRLILCLDKASWLTSTFLSASIYLTLSFLIPPTDTLIDVTDVASYGNDAFVGVMDLDVEVQKFGSVPDKRYLPSRATSV